MRALALVTVLFTACDPPTPACRQAEARLACPECYDGEVTCSLDGVTVTEGSCGDCQARVALYEALCDAGSQVTQAQLDAPDVCGDPVRE